MKAVILRHSYTRNRDTARAALRYYQMRPRGEGEPPRSLFTRDGTVSRDEAYRMLDAHQARGYLVHRLMLSPAADERPDDLRDLTRYVLRELETQQGTSLHWIAVEHRNTDYPHVHVVLAGGTETTDGPQEMRLDRADHARMREDGMKYCRVEKRERVAWERALVDAAARIARNEQDAADAREGRDHHDR